MSHSLNHSVNRSRTLSCITHWGKGREGIRKGKERNATAILLVVESDESSFKLKSVTREEVDLDGRK